MHRVWCVGLWGGCWSSVIYNRGDIRRGIWKADIWWRKAEWSELWAHPVGRCVYVYSSWTVNLILCPWRSSWLSDPSLFMWKWSAPLAGNVPLAVAADTSAHKATSCGDTSAHSNNLSYVPAYCMSSVYCDAQKSPLSSPCIKPNVTFFKIKASDGRLTLDSVC